MLRRQQMEREIEQHELERNQTAHPLSTEGGGDDLEEQVKKLCKLCWAHSHLQFISGVELG